MARDETDREDLFREATALVERIELAPVGERAGEHVVAGFRAGGAVSIFLGADPVYQFNAAGELRRAYCDGRMIKASRGRLVSLCRERLANETQLLSRELSDGEQCDFLARMGERLRALAAGLDAGGYKVVDQVPADEDVLARVQNWLADHDGRTIANSPRVVA